MAALLLYCGLTGFDQGREGDRHPAHPAPQPGEDRFQALPQNGFVWQKYPFSFIPFSDTRKAICPASTCNARRRRQCVVMICSTRIFWTAPIALFRLKCQKTNPCPDTGYPAFDFNKASPGCRSSYQSAALFSSSSASGWLTTCMELGANVPNGFLYRAAGDLALLDLAGAPVNDLVPLLLRPRPRCHRGWQ